MVYRVKGTLTKKQREAIVAHVRPYFALVGDKDIEIATRTLVETAFRPWISLCMFALYIDEVKMLEKVIGGSK